MSHVPPIPWCFVFQSKQRYPMSILISMKGCGLPGNQPWFYSPDSDFSISGNICNQPGSKMTSMQEGFAFLHGLWMPYQRRPAHDANIQWQRWCYTVKAISRLCMQWQPWPWYSLIFWSTKLILNSHLILSKNQGKTDMNLEQNPPLSEKLKCRLVAWRWN